MTTNVHSSSSFEEIIEENTASIFRICRIYAVAPMEPQDLFQEVVYHIWKSFSSYNGGAKLSTWIYRIALNVCVRYKLKLDKHNGKTSRLASITVLPAIEKDSDRDEERSAALRACIQDLKEGDRSIIILHLEGLAYKEISGVTGMTENHIAVKMKRIRKLLFHCITPK